MSNSKAGTHSTSNRIQRYLPIGHAVREAYLPTLPKFISTIRFNGRSQRIQGREALLLGLDDIAELHETNLPPLLHHKLFHRYHHAFFAFEPVRNEPLWVRLWAEGLATYASRKLNPLATNMDTLWIENPQLKNLDEKETAIATAFLGRFSSESPQDASLYFMDDQSKDQAIPARAGYYLGLKIAELLGRSYSLQQMAHWNRAEAEPRIRAALEELRTHPDSRASEGL